MATRLEKADWNNFFARLTQLLVGKHTDIEVLNPSLGNQMEALRLPLLGIAYDPEDDLIEIQLEGLDHMVARPRILYVDYTPGVLVSLQIVDEAGMQQIVLMRDPPMLPHLSV
jgi:hypothetical protein